ncbi:kinase-like domain-containing protein [Xylaria sp. FL1042]|nr:kinase-like domain-containing protein [Xylaria sp. FL1042]
MFDRLVYTFQWADYAATKAYESRRDECVISGLGGPEYIDVKLPTPLPNGRMIGTWALEVVCATNTRGQVATIKMIDRTAQNFVAVDKEIRAFKEVTAFAKIYDEGGRLLRLVDVLSHYKEGSDRAPGVIPIEVARMFRGALKGLQAMHSHGWMHRDLKPGNIGLVGRPARAVLLDFGASIHLPATEMQSPAPRCVGTVNWIAPELELINYYHSVDIWTTGCPGKDNEAMRPLFDHYYNQAVWRMNQDFETVSYYPIDGYIHLGTLFTDMVRYPYGWNSLPRPTIDEALNHLAWAHCCPTLQTL